MREIEEIEATVRAGIGGERLPSVREGADALEALNELSGELRARSDVVRAAMAMVFADGGEVHPYAYGDFRALTKACARLRLLEQQLIPEKDTENA